MADSSLSIRPDTIKALMSALQTMPNMSQTYQTSSTRLCVVVPCYNEEAMLPAFFEVVCPFLEKATEGRWSILCVDDGSRDSTFAIVSQWNRRESRIRGVRLSRNFGHQAALSAGMVYARGQYIGVMDCDLQDPVEVLVQLYEACLRDNVDVCYGIRGKRDAPIHLRMAYSMFYKIINRAADHAWPKNVGDFCVMSAQCQAALLALPETSRMLRGLRSWVGFRQTGIVYDRPARMHGQSKYNIPKLIGLALQGLISFSHVPLRLAGFMGLAMGVFSILFGAVMLINRLVPSFTLFGFWVGANPGVATLVVFLAFSFSILFICIGIVGEYLIVLLKEVKGRPAAIVGACVGDLRPLDSAYPMLSPPTGAAIEKTA